MNIAYTNEAINSKLILFHLCSTVFVFLIDVIVNVHVFQRDLGEEIMIEG